VADDEPVTRTLPKRVPDVWRRLIVLAAAVAVVAGLGASISEWLQFGTVVALGTLAWSLRHLRDDERGDRALVVSLLGIAILGAVLFVSVSSLHSWRWVGGLVVALAFPLVVKGIGRLGDRPSGARGETLSELNDPTADVWRKLPPR
jgi:MFS family permease